ncbi:MAG: bifunctional DNA primase/polymerase, partial [bacterium]
MAPVNPVTGDASASIKKFANAPRSIRKWNWQDKAVGVATGEASGVVVVFVATGSEAPDGLPATFTVLAPNGTHYWLRVPKGVISVPSCELAPGVRLLGAGDFAAADPFECFDADGESTGWSGIANASALAEMPDWLVKQAARQGAVEIAQAFIAKGWAPIPVPRKGKKPVLESWQNLVVRAGDAHKHFKPDDNVGVLLGPKSGGLTDVDLDCAEALLLAPHFLPATPAVFGRASKPRSHRLYKTDLGETESGAALQFKGADKKMLFELRIGAGGKGAQSVFPGSTHHSGESIAWDDEGEPAKVKGADLKQAAAKLAAAVILARAWPPESGRHDAALALSGFLKRCVGWENAEIKHFIKAVATAAGDD